MNPTLPHLSNDDAGRLHELLGARPVHAHRLTERGYSNVHRLLVGLDDGRSAFVKRAADPQTAGWLRDEHRAYAELGGSFMPRLLGWVDAEHPLLVLEDLSSCHWPPPWSSQQVGAVLDALAELAACRPFPGLGKVTGTVHAQSGWAEVARDPAPFLALGLCSPGWLDRALLALLDASGDATCLDGDAVLHLDVRSDNLCFRDGRALLVDWNLAAVGDARYDIAFWLPSLHAEGGPPPESVASVPPEHVALVAGFFACRAGLPVIPAAPRVRDVQLSQLRTALPWCARVLGLPEPG
ncbi:phosphotransferase [Streptomyces sp. V4I2]|uniref:phosphotransferase n=1 Tax=Streptomyces sp. V4I2 TaxID=3042280 RepID=UPI002789E497|nr:phosphotransferase [Streptomyces sp. V4I2]MDQ1043851.1 hypothetical protein [Streptomyces sp. V4I2]